MHILIISMDTILIKILNDYLSDQGHTVENTKSIFDLNKALEEFGTETDLLLLDLDVKHVRNFKLLYKLHQNFPHIPIAVITSISGVLPAGKSLSCGIYAYLRKPLCLSEMDLMISRLKRNGHMNNHPEDGQSPTMQ